MERVDLIISGLEQVQSKCWPLHYLVITLSYTFSFFVVYFVYVLLFCLTVDLKKESSYIVRFKLVNWGWKSSFKTSFILANRSLLYYHTNFKIIRSSSVNSAIGILIGIALSL